MKTRRRQRLLRLGVITTAFWVVIIAGVFLAMPTDRMRELFVQEVRATTGLEARFSGEAGLTLWPSPGLDLGQLSVVDPKAPGAAVLRAASTVVRPSARFLLRGEWQPGTLQMADVDLDVRRAWNDLQVRHRFDSLGLDWQGRARALSVSLDGSLQDRSLAIQASVQAPARLWQGAMTDVDVAVSLGPDVLTYQGVLALPPRSQIPNVDGTWRADLPVGVSGLITQLGLDLPTMLGDLTGTTAEGRLQIADNGLQVRGRASGELRARPVNVELMVEGIAGWRSVGEIDVSTTVRVGGAVSAHVDGVWSAPVGLQSDLNISVLDLPMLLAWLGLPANPMPELGNTPRLSSLLALSDNRALLAEVRVPGHPVWDNAEVTISTEGAGSLTLSPRLARLELNDLPPAMLVSTASGLRDWTGLGPALVLDLRVQDVRLDGLALGRGSAAIALRPDGMALTARAGSPRNGWVDLAMDHRFQDTAPLALSLALSATSPQAAALDFIWGNLDGDVQLSLSAQAESWTPERVTGTLSATDGILQVPSLNAVLDGSVSSGSVSSGSVSSGSVNSGSVTTFTVFRTAIERRYDTWRLTDLRFLTDGLDVAGAITVLPDGALAGELQADGVLTGRPAEMQLSGTLLEPVVTASSAEADSPTADASPAALSEPEGTPVPPGSDISTGTVDSDTDVPVPAVAPR
ncbi:MAG: hypothetical protein AAF674_11160 [Pseudomonadota bacterium]